MVVQDIDNKKTSSLVLRFSIIRLMLQLAYLDLELFHIDVKTVFVNGVLDEQI